MYTLILNMHTHILNMHTHRKSWEQFLPGHFQYSVEFCPQNCGLSSLGKETSTYQEMVPSSLFIRQVKPLKKIGHQRAHHDLQQAWGAMGWFHVHFILKEKILGNILDIFIYVFWLPHAFQFPGQLDAFIFKSYPWFQDKHAVRNLAHHWMKKEIWKLRLLLSLESQITL